MSSTPESEHLNAMRCPRCRTDANEGFVRYVEKIEAWRTVRGVRGGVLHIDSEYRSGGGYDDGEDPMFECHSPRGAGGWYGHRWRADAWVLDAAVFDIEPVP